RQFAVAYIPRRRGRGRQDSLDGMISRLATLRRIAFEVQHGPEARPYPARSTGANRAAARDDQSAANVAERDPRWEWAQHRRQSPSRRPGTRASREDHRRPQDVLRPRGAGQYLRDGPDLQY